jgi:HAD superfamily hydrolase (TIGR01549 family)
MRAILFDFGGTIDYPQHWLDRFWRHYQAAGFSLARAELDCAFNKATSTAYQCAAKLRTYRLDELVLYLVELQFAVLRGSHLASLSRVDLRDAVSARRLAAQISASFVEETQQGLARSRDVIAGLARRFRIGVVSNFYGNLDRILHDADFAEIVAAIADSGRLGFYKPDLRIYREALAAIGMNAAETLMVGDSLNKDCAPARALGMRTIWLRHREAAELQNSPPADFTIGALDELQDLAWRIS